MVLGGYRYGSFPDWDHTMAGGIAPITLLKGPYIGFS